MRQTEIHFEDTEFTSITGKVHTFKMNPMRKLDLIIKALRNIIKEEDKLHMMDCNLPIGSDEKISSAIEELEYITEYDPTDDMTNSEPSITADEMHSSAWKQHLALHS
jgi:hypothetical protein